VEEKPAASEEAPAPVESTPEAPVQSVETAEAQNGSTEAPAAEPAAAEESQPTAAELKAKLAAEQPQVNGNGTVPVENGASNGNAEPVPDIVEA